MRISIDLDTLAVTSTASALTRRKTSTIDVIFTRNGVQTELDSPATGHVALTAAATLVAGGSTTSWTKRGSGLTAIYTFALDCNTTAVEALFASQTKPVPAILTIDWTIDEVPFESAPIAVSINNANFTGDEGTPSALPDGKASQAEAEAGTDNEKWMTPLRTAQAIAALSSSGAGPSSFYDIGTFSGEETVNLDISHGQNQRLQIGSNIALNLPTPSDGQRLVLYVYSSGGAWGFQINGNIYYGLFDGSPKTLTENRWARYEFEYVTSQWNFIGFLSEIIWD